MNKRELNQIWEKQGKPCNKEREFNLPKCLIPCEICVMHPQEEKILQQAIEETVKEEKSPNKIFSGITEKYNNLKKKYDHQCIEIGRLKSEIFNLKNRKNV